MTARERLTETLRNPGLVGLDEEETAELIDAFAHELAEQIRAERGSGTYEPGVYFRSGMDYGADLIDPKATAGPGRPNEEPTP